MGKWGGLLLVVKLVYIEAFHETFHEAIKQVTMIMKLRSTSRNIVTARPHLLVWDRIINLLDCQIFT